MMITVANVEYQVNELKSPDGGTPATAKACEELLQRVHCDCNKAGMQNAADLGVTIRNCAKPTEYARMCRTKRRRRHHHDQQQQQQRQHLRLHFFQYRG